MAWNSDLISALVSIVFSLAFRAKSYLDMVPWVDALSLPPQPPVLFGRWTRRAMADGAR